MENGLLSILDAAVLKYLCSRGYVQAHAALRQELGLDDSQQVGAAYDLTEVFMGYVNAHTKEVHAAAHVQRLRDAHSQGHLQYDGRLLSECQGILSQSSLDIGGNEMKRMRAVNGRIPAAPIDIRLPPSVAGLKRKAEAARMIPNQTGPGPVVQAYNSQRLMQLPTGQALSMDCRFVQRNIRRVPPHRQNSTVVNLPNGGSSSGQLPVMNGMVTSTGGSMNGHALQMHQVMQNGGGGGQLPVSFSGYGVSGQVPAHAAGVHQRHAFGLAGAQCHNPMGLQSIRHVHNLHNLPGLSRQQMHHLNAAQAAAQLQSRGSDQLAAQVVHTNAVALQGNGVSPLGARASLQHALQQQQPPASTSLIQPVGGELHSRPSINMQNHHMKANEAVCSPLTPIRSAVATATQEEGVHRAQGRAPPPTAIQVAEANVASMHMAAQEAKGMKFNSSGGPGPAATATAAAAACAPASAVTGGTTTHALSQEISPSGAQSSHKYVDSGNPNPMGVVIGNSSSVSSTDVNGDVGGNSGHTNTPSSDKTPIGLTKPESPDLNFSRPGGALGIKSDRDLERMDSLGFSCLDTLDDFLNEGGT